MLKKDLIKETLLIVEKCNQLQIDQINSTSYAEELRLMKLTDLNKNYSFWNERLKLLSKIDDHIPIIDSYIERTLRRLNIKIKQYNLPYELKYIDNKFFLVNTDSSVKEEIQVTEKDYNISDSLFKEVTSYSELHIFRSLVLNTIREIQKRI